MVMKRQGKTMDTSRATPLDVRSAGGFSAPDSKSSLANDCKQPRSSMGNGEIPPAIAANPTFFGLDGYRVGCSKDVVDFRNASCVKIKGRGR